MNLTLAEALAMAVLKGDTAAAYALADQLLEERARGNTPLDAGYEEVRRLEGAMSYQVYSWPEFKALCRRAGILWNLTTTDLVIELPLDGPLTIRQGYRGINRGEQT